MTEQPVKKIHFVSCVKGKLSQPAPARQLYQSLWFNSARTLLENKKADWFILSAHHGLVEPEQVIAPYDVTLKTMTSQARKLWAAQTAQAITARLDPQLIVLLAGKDYRQFLIPLLTERGFTFELPLAHLGIGSQIKQMQLAVRGV